MALNKTFDSEPGRLYAISLTSLQSKKPDKQLDIKVVVAEVFLESKVFNSFVSLDIQDPCFFFVSTKIPTLKAKKPTKQPNIIVNSSRLSIVKPQIGVKTPVPAEEKPIKPRVRGNPSPKPKTNTNPSGSMPKFFTQHMSTTEVKGVTPYQEESDKKSLTNKHQMVPQNSSEFVNLYRKSLQGRLTRVP